MQLNPRYSGLVFLWPQLSFPVLIGLFLGLCGCADRPSTIDVPPTMPYQQSTLKVAAAHTQDIAVIRLLAKSWGIRNQVTVTVSETLNDPTADILISTPQAIGAFADQGELVYMPSDYQRATHPYRWDELFTGISSRLCTWKDKIVAIPLLGEGLIFVYRTDHFQAKDGQPVNAPKSWEDILKLAQTNPKTALAAWPTDPQVRETIFFTIAASYDRLSINRIAPGTIVRDDFFSFQFDMLTGQSRINTPAFVAAAELMSQCHQLMTAGASPAESFNQHQAKFGIMTLRDLAQLDPALCDRISVMPLPGTRFTINENGDKKPIDGGNINRVPYVGGNLRVGMVLTRCQNKEAAWDFLMDAGLPESQSLDLIAATQWGAGPYRSSHLDARVRPRWLGYRLTMADTDRLISALRENQNLTAQNPRYPLRTPNQAALNAVFRPQLEAIITGKEKAKPALDAVNTEWNKIAGQTPPDAWKATLKKSIGL